MATTTISKGQPGSKAWFKDSFVLHKLHSLSGVIPIGAFLIFHLFVNSYALRGEVEFNTAARAISYLPFVQIVEWLVIFIPILFHTVYGFLIVAEMQGPGGNIAHYGYSRNWLYVLQRWSGVVAIAYMLYHIYDTWGIKKYYETVGGDDLGHAAISYASMAWRFTDVWYLAIYVIGITAASFHLGNGLFNFCIRWGISIGREAQRITAILGWLVFIGLTGLGVATAVTYTAIANNYEGKGPIRQQYASFDAMVKAKVEEHKAEGTAPTDNPITRLPGN